MRKFLKPIVFTLFAYGTGYNSLLAENSGQQAVNTTQILDTSILFTIGAREAEQAIRGSFGWPTFQEGFVDNVYFRFDPDGFARFSTSPRLDEDVFEVICAQSSTACLAKKNGIEIGLNLEGKIQLRLSGITPNDRFFVADKTSELPLPPAILGALDSRLETLLSSSTDLVVKRELEVIQKISLSGFSAVATYLRWVAQGQSPRVFPRGWPVPAQGGEQVSGLTHPGSWLSPNAAPQYAETTFAQQTSRNPEGSTFGRQNYGKFQTQNTNHNGNLSSFESGINLDSNSGFVKQEDLNTISLQETLDNLRKELAALKPQNAQNQRQPSTEFQRRIEPNGADQIEVFSQQAQGRNLAPAAGLSFQRTPTSYDVDRKLETSGLRSENITNFKRDELRNVDIEHDAKIQNLMLRVQSLETAFSKLQINIERQLSTFAAQRDATVPAGAVMHDTIATEHMPATRRDLTSKSMSNLEKLLLEKLDDQPSASTVIKSKVENGPEISTENSIISSLLRELSIDVDSEVDVQERSQAVDNPIEEAEDSADFVNLSDYINQVLKAEKNSNQN